MRIIGVDYGLARIGLAVWDSQADLVLPLEVIHEGDFSAAVRKISRLCADESADLVVVGQPTALSGQKTGEQVTATERFVAALREQVKVPVETEDERLSSGLADRHMEQARDQTAGRDALAAAAILESYIDRHGVSQD